MVEDFAKREEDRHVIGETSSYDAARVLAAQRVERVLAEFQRPQQTAESLFELWSMFGEDVYIVPESTRDPFSAMDYARLSCVRLTGDSRLPVWLQVTCVDRLNTSSGAPSGEGRWVFWVNAPATCAGATRVIRRAVEKKYDQMSDEAYAGDDSTYSLLVFDMRQLTPEEIAAAPWKQRGNTAFVLQVDGTLAPIPSSG